MTNLRFEILNDVVDYFVICESNYDHRNQIKGFNFQIKNKKYFDKIIYLKIFEPFPEKNNPWENQALQRDYILKKIFANDEDYLIFSDPDEIPNPENIFDLNLRKKYGIFMQRHFMYKFNIVADQYSPWEGSRVSKFKNILSIDNMRQKILKKNIKKWWRLDKERSIELIENGGWHFNNFLSSKELSLKLRTFAHIEFSEKKYSDPAIIEKKIKLREDLFGRNHFFKKIKEDNFNILPSYVLNNLNEYKNYFE